MKENAFFHRKIPISECSRLNQMILTNQMTEIAPSFAPTSESQYDISTMGHWVYTMYKLKKQTYEYYKEMDKKEIRKNITQITQLQLQLRQIP